MADEQENKEEQSNDEKTENKEKSGSTSLLVSILPWIILAAIVIISAGAGFGLDRIVAGPAEQENVTQAPPPIAQTIDSSLENIKTDRPTNNTWYYPLEPVVSNLNETGAMRYIRVKLTLAVNPRIDKKKGTKFIDERKPILTSWLAIYLASLTIDDCTGDKNLRRIQSQIRDAFNEKLFPDTKPQIREILYEEFAIQ